MVLYTFFMGFIFVIELVCEVVFTNLLFLLVFATTNTRTELHKTILISCLVGFLLWGISLLNFSSAETFFVEIIAFVASSIVLQKKIRLKKFLILELVLVAYILLGWGVSYLTQLIFFNLFRLNAVTYVIFIVVKNLIILVIGVITLCFFKLSYSRKDIEGLIYNTIIELGGESVKFKLFLDSGNSLVDELVSGLPVLVVSYSALESGFNGKLRLNCCRTLTASTISGNSELPIIHPQKIMIEINGQLKETQAVIGVVKENFKYFDGLLNPGVM